MNLEIVLHSWTNTSPSIVSCINLIDKLAEFYIELHMSAVPLKSEAFGRFENSLLQRINFEKTYIRIP